MRKLLLIPFLLFSTICFASAPNRTYTYVSHAVIDPNQNNTNENNLYSYLQNGVDTYAAGSISDVSISSSAAISYSKLNLLNSILNADINSSAAISYSKLNLIGSIVNADINASASIADSKLATISTAGKVSGASLTSFSSIPSGAGVIPTANLGSGTANSGTILYGDQTYKTAPASLSNVLFQFSAAVTETGSGEGEIIGTDLGPTTATGNYRFLSHRDTGNSSFAQVWGTKFIKISGISTVKVYGQLWGNLAGGQQNKLEVDIGGQNSSVSGTANQSIPEWVNLTIDVSSLSNGTTYDVSVYVAHSANSTGNAYLGNLIAFGS